MTAESAQELGLKPLAKIKAYRVGRASIRRSWAWARCRRRKRCLEKAGWKPQDLDLMEINEAFAAQACAVNKEMGWDTSKINVNGGAIALGHPIGASGCRVLVTLLHEMQQARREEGPRVAVHRRRHGRGARGRTDMMGTQSEIVEDRRPWQPRRDALVTGGMGGLGKAICRQLAARRLHGRGGLPARLRQEGGMAGADARRGPTTSTPPRATSRTSSPAPRCSTTSRSVVGPVDVLVNNAGITRDMMFKRMTEQDWDAVIKTNLDCVFNITRQVIDGMTDRGWGRIINISSVNAIKGAFGQTNYSAAKAGMHGFTKALALEVVRKGVTVNTISPGYVETEMVMAIPKEVLDADRPADPDGPPRPSPRRSPRWSRTSPRRKRPSSPAPTSRSTAACT